MSDLHDTDLDDSDLEENEDEQISCPICDGSGELGNSEYSIRYCNACDGTGYTTETELDQSPF